MATLRIGTALLEGAGIARGYLKVGDMPDGRAMQIPVLLGRGAAPGPTLWLHGCVHGNEACGALIVHRLFRELDPATLSGTLVGLPILNITAFRARQRMSPFEGFAGGDLNRCFPGKSDGTLTEQMAHAIYTELRAHANYFVDLHTAMTADVRWALFANAPGDAGKKAEGMARAFGFASTLPAPMDILAGSAMMAAARDGIPSLIVEAGGKGPAFTVEVVTEVVERLRNVLRHLGMLSGKVADHGPLTYFSNFAWVRAARGGLFQRAVRCGERLKVGTVLGHYYDIWGQPTGEALSPHAGVVLAIHPGPVMASGETLVHIGLDPREV
ncbi:MAG TPA: succinylglutamate desuccinylase/aspartoacylase family protein [Candidatus Methylomirabilis sp.]|nr:succinylglutamate desuccinylase/aspartoacylase family protein [Candidatus Methylomirabilis sp.]